MKISLFQADLSLKFYHAEWGIAKIFITFFIDIRHHEFRTKWYNIFASGQKSAPCREETPLRWSYPISPGKILSRAANVSGSFCV